MPEYSKIFEWLIPAIIGVAGKTIVDYVFYYKKNQLLNDQILVETGFKAGETWDRIVIRLENQLERQRVEIERMGMENEELREELIRIRNYKNFDNAEK